MQHSFDVEIAKEYGILEAILMQHIYFWIEKNKANRKHLYDGKYWTYNSRKAFSELFPYASEKQIRRVLESLVKKNLLITGNYNKQWSDRTLWYTFTDYGISIIKKSQMQLPVKANDNCPDGQMTIAQEGTPIPYINTDIKSNNTPYNPSTDDSQKYDNKIFEKFWNEYPKKISKGNAEKWFKKNKPTNDLVDLMIEKLKIYKETEQWKKDNGKYIPYPSSWLNAKGWEDEIQANNIKRKYDTSIVYHDKYIGDYKFDENGRRIFV